MSKYIITGGTILTANPPSPRVDAVLVRGNSIDSVGTNAEIRKNADANIKILDLDGRTLVPGFNDSHIHLYDVGRQEMMVDLFKLTKGEILEKLQERVRRLKPREPIWGKNWDYPSCPDPHKSDLDKVFPDRPVLLMQFSGHGGWANSKGLEFLNIGPGKSEWEYGGAETDSNGDFTGILREPGGSPRLRNYWMRQMVKRESIREAIPTALSALAPMGITSIQDNTWLPRTVTELSSIHRRGELTARISCWSLGQFPPLDFWMSLKRFKSNWYARGPQKYFIDGAFSTKTAWLSEPYADGSTSQAGKSTEDIEHWLKKAGRQSRQIACHSIGDAATGAYCSAIERIARKAQIQDGIQRHRIEHGQLISPEDIERIARYGMVVSAQPHAAADPEKDERLLGAERARRAYPYRDLLNAGVTLAFGSDFPGEYTFNPLLGIHLAVNREGGQAITAQEAVSCYTAGSAKVEFAEDKKGQIREGLLADFAILSADPTKVPPETIKDIEVDGTIVDGNFVFKRAGFDGEFERVSDGHGTAHNQRR